MRRLWRVDRTVCGAVLVALRATHGALSAGELRRWLRRHSVRLAQSQVDDALRVLTALGRAEVMTVDGGLVWGLSAAERIGAARSRN